MRGRLGGISSVSLKADSSLCGGSLLVRCFHTLHFLHSRHILLFPVSDMRLSKASFRRRRTAALVGGRRICSRVAAFRIFNRGDFASAEATRALRSPWTFGCMQAAFSPTRGFRDCGRDQGFPVALDLRPQADLNFMPQQKGETALPSQLLYKQPEGSRLPFVCLGEIYCARTVGTSISPAMILAFTSSTSAFSSSETCWVMVSSPYTTSM